MWAWLALFIKIEVFLLPWQQIAGLWPHGEAITWCLNPNKQNFQFYTVNYIPALANSVDTDEKQLIRKELNH